MEKKKIYFACSIRGGRDDADVYATIVDLLKDRTELLTEIFADQKLTSQGMDKPNDEIWKVDMEWVRAADAIIAEVTNPSLGVGYEIAKAEEWGKPVLALFRPTEGKRLSAMIEGSPHVHTEYYANHEELSRAIENFIVSLDQ